MMFKVPQELNTVLDTGASLNIKALKLTWAQREINEH